MTSNGHFTFVEHAAQGERLRLLERLVLVADFV